jgi:hypothetical protein
MTVIANPMTSFLTVSLRSGVLGISSSSGTTAALRWFLAGVELRAPPRLLLRGLLAAPPRGLLACPLRALLFEAVRALVAVLFLAVVFFAVLAPARADVARGFALLCGLRCALSCALCAVLRAVARAAGFEAVLCLVFK